MVTAKTPEKPAPTRPYVPPKPNSLAMKLNSKEQAYVAAWWRVDVDDLGQIDADDPRARRAIAYLRAPTRWSEHSPRGFLATTTAISIPITTDGHIEIRTFEKATKSSSASTAPRNRPQHGCKRAWLVQLPCHTLRVLVQWLSLGNFRPGDPVQARRVVGPGRPLKRRSVWR